MPFTKVCRSGQFGNKGTRYIPFPCCDNKWGKVYILFRPRLRRAPKLHPKASRMAKIRRCRSKILKKCTETSNTTNA